MTYLLLQEEKKRPSLLLLLWFIGINCTVVFNLACYFPGLISVMVSCLGLFNAGERVADLQLHVERVHVACRGH